MSRQRSHRPTGPPSARRRSGMPGAPPQELGRPPHPPGSGGEADRAPLLADAPLFADVRARLAEPSPWPLLELVSSLIAAVDERDADPFARVTPAPEPGGTDFGGLVRCLFGVVTPESTALLAVVAELVADEVMARRIARELATRSHGLPSWLDELSPPQVVRILELSHVLGDGDTIALGLRTPAGDEGTLVVHIDHHLGSLVKDAFVVANPLGTVADRFLEAAHEDPDLTVAELDRADARARLTRAADAATRTSSAPETDSWPGCRPLLEWAVRGLPPGGRGDDRPAWSPQERDTLAEEFLHSPTGRRHDHDEGRQVLEALLSCACGHGNGDPLRWSPARIELLLTDWLPRELALPAPQLLSATELLADVVRFGHDRLGLRGEHTSRALAAVRACTPDFEDLVRKSDAMTAAAALARIAGGDAQVRWEVPFDDDLLPAGYREMMLDLLRETVGGDEALRDLDTAPLPHETLELPALPDDVHDRVAAVADLTDGCCDQLLDREHRTACRRLLVDVAAADPRIFRRRGRPETAAAAVVWMVAKANRSFDAHTPGGLRSTGLAEWFGIVGGPSARASTMLRALEIGDSRRDGTELRLGTPRYLVASRRRGILDHWHRLVEAAD